MQSNSDIIKKAKKYVKRYKICCIVLSIGISSLYCMIALYGNVIAIISALIVSLLLFFIGGRIVFNKCIISVLSKKLDADTYLNTVYLGKFDTPTALWQLYGEYFCGHYQNVITICKMKLDDPKISKRYRYCYLTYLANVYFDIGDDEKLSKICEQYEIALMKAKPSEQANCRTRFARMTFYDLYLKHNVDACMAWMNNPTSIVLNQYHRMFCKARLAIMQGDLEEARGYYETLAKEIPQLNYGKIATKKLADMDNQSPEDFSKTFQISDESVEITLYPTNHRKLRKILVICLVAFFVIYFTLGLLRVSESENKHEREIEAYQECIRVLVEQDYDDVMILDTFELKNGEEVVDTMFICKTDTDIIVGCVYVYDGQTEQYYEKMIDFPIESFSEERSPLWYCSFPSVTSHNQIESYFYSVESEVPSEYCHLSTFELNGQTVYYVVTEIVPGLRLM